MRHLPCEQLMPSGPHRGPRCEQMLCNYKLIIHHDAQEGQGRGPLWEVSSRDVHVVLLSNQIHICQLIIDRLLHLGHLADAFLQSDLQ